MIRLAMGFLGLIVAALLMVAHANASVVMDDDSGTAKFRVKGSTKLISAMEAAIKAPTTDIEQGKPIKNAQSEDGKSVAVYKWREVNYTCKQKTGNCSWKSK